MMKLLLLSDKISDLSYQAHKAQKQGKFRKVSKLTGKMNKIDKEARGLYSKYRKREDVDIDSRFISSRELPFDRDEFIENRTSMDNITRRTAEWNKTVKEQGTGYNVEIVPVRSWTR